MPSREISRVELESFVRLRTNRDENRRVVRHLLSKFSDAIEAGYLEDALNATEREPAVPPGLYDRAFALAMEIPLPPQIPLEPSELEPDDDLRDHLDDQQIERAVG